MEEGGRPEKNEIGVSCLLLYTILDDKAPIRTNTSTIGNCTAG